MSLSASGLSRVSKQPTTQKGDTHMEKDPVCGMQVDPNKAAGTSEYQGKTYYFCNPGCKRKFETNPEQYA